MTIYERIQEVAKRKRITVRDIERFLGYANGSLRKWKDNANSKRLLEVAEFLDVSVDYLLGKTSFADMIKKPGNDWLDDIAWEIDREREFELRRGVFIAAFNSLVEYSVLTETARGGMSKDIHERFRKDVANISDIDKEKITMLIQRIFFDWVAVPEESKNTLFNLIDNAYKDFSRRERERLYDEQRKNKE